MTENLSAKLDRIEQTPAEVRRTLEHLEQLSQHRHGNADYCGHRPSESCDDCCPDCGIAKPARTLAERIRESRLEAQARFDAIGLPDRRLAH